MSDKDILTNQEEYDEYEIVEITDEDGNVTQCYLVDVRDYKGVNYAFLRPAEEVEGEDFDAVSIYEISGDDESGILLPVENEALLEEIYADFMKDYDPEYPEYDLEEEFKN